jgi:hypothetical protein
VLIIDPLDGLLGSEALLEGEGAACPKGTAEEAQA